MENWRHAHYKESRTEACISSGLVGWCRKQRLLAKVLFLDVVLTGYAHPRPLLSLHGWLETTPLCKCATKNDVSRILYEF